MSEKSRILVIEDDSAMAGGIVRGLRSAGFDVELSTSGPDGARRALEGHYDLVTLDLMLPGESGFGVLEKLRGRMSAPVIVLTARAELGDRLQSFELGASDFVAKPFFIEELVARIRTRLRLSGEGPKRIVSWADAEIDLDARTAVVSGKAVALTRHEFDVLAHLIERPDRAISRQQLAERALMPFEERDARTVDSHVARIRKKIGPAAAAHILTVWGIGYRFAPGGDPA
jgi:DNA-binding response OmpR family regulator